MLTLQGSVPNYFSKQASKGSTGRRTPSTGPAPVWCQSAPPGADNNHYAPIRYYDRQRHNAIHATRSRRDQSGNLRHRPQLCGCYLVHGNKQNQSKLGQADLVRTLTLFLGHPQHLQSQYIVLSIRYSLWYINLLLASLFRLTNV